MSENAQTDRIGTVLTVKPHGCPVPSQVLTDSASYDVDEEQGTQFPDGGKEAWLVVLGSWCAMTPAMGLLNSLAVLQAWLGEHELHNLPESTTGWIFSIYTFFLFFCGAQIGPLFDAYDIRLFIVPGANFTNSSSPSASLAVSLVHFSTTQPLSVIGHWFYKNRGLATGIACTAGGIGGIWMPLVILYLGPRIGFGWSLRLIALICALHGALACILLRKRLISNKKAGTNVDVRALKDVKYAAMTLGLVLIEFAIFIPISYICSYGIHSGWSTRDAYLLNALLNAGAVPGRFLPGFVADRFGVVNTMTVITFASIITVFGIWLPAHGSHTMTLSFTILYGFWSGAIGCIRTRMHRSSLFGTLIGIPIAGAIIEASHGSYQGLIIFSGCSYVVAFAAYLFGRSLSIK